MKEQASNVLRSYKDLDLNFKVHPIKKDINKTIGENAIIASVKNLLLTDHYERPFQPYLGSNIKKLLFEPLDTLTARSIDTEIKTVLTNFEKRVDVISVNVIANYDQNGFNVTLTIRPKNLITPLQINFFLQRVR
jgi:phage baseplate assembly protein W